MRRSTQLQNVNNTAGLNLFLQSSQQTRIERRDGRHVSPKCEHVPFEIESFFEDRPKGRLSFDDPRTKSTAHPLSFRSPNDSIIELSLHEIQIDDRKLSGILANARR
jgi:hypothetical protein